MKVSLMEVAYSAANYDVVEPTNDVVDGVEAGSSVDVTVRLTPVSDRAVEIPIVVRANSAETGDYDVTGLSLLSKLRFLAGDNSKRYTITGNSDLDGDNEAVALSFGSLPVGVQAGVQAVATVTIHEPSSTVSPGAVPRRPTEADDMLSATGRINGEILVDWTTVTASPPVNGYTLRYQTKLGSRIRRLSTWSEWNLCPLLPEVTRDTEFTHTGVNTLTKYRYQLQVSNPHGDSDWSATFPENGVSPLADILSGLGIRSWGTGGPSLHEFELLIDCFDPICGPGQEETVSLGDLSQSTVLEHQEKSGSGVWSRWASGPSGASGTSGPRQPVSSPITFSNRVAAVDDSRSILSTYGVSNLDTTMVHQIRVRLVNADDVPGDASDSVAVVPLRARRSDEQVTLEWDNPGNGVGQSGQRPRRGVAVPAQPGRRQLGDLAGGGRQ